MTKTDDNKLAMLKAVLSLLKQYQSEWQNIASFVEAVLELESIIALIDATRETTETDQSGPVTEKKTIREMLIDKAFEILSQLSALAAKTKDQVLEGKVNFTKSDLQAMRQNLLVSTCKSFVKAGREYITPLGIYNVTSVDIDNFEALNTSYASRVPEYRVSISGRKAENESMHDSIKNGLHLLKEQISRMMVRFETTKPTFYAAYLNAIKVIDYGTRHEKGNDPPTDPNKPAV
jgi:hypothetical protein